MESPSRDGKVESEADARRVFDERIRWQVKQFPASALEGVEARWGWPEHFVGVVVGHQS